MNFRALQDEVCADFTTTMRPRAIVWLNAAYQEFLARRRWSFLETTSSAIALTASTQTYDLVGGTPVVTDFAGMIAVELEMAAAGIRVPIREMDGQTFSLCTSHSRVNGTPAFWTILGGAAASTSSTVAAGGRQQLALWPIPTASANQGVNVYLRYDRSAAGIEMVNDNDVPIMGAQHHMALVYGAKAIGFEAFNQTDQGQQQRQLFLQRLEAAAKEDESMRMRDQQRVELTTRQWQYPLGGAKQNGAPAAADPYPAAL